VPVGHRRSHVYIKRLLRIIASVHYCGERVCVFLIKDIEYSICKFYGQYFSLFYKLRIENIIIVIENIIIGCSYKKEKTNLFVTLMQYFSNN